MQVSLPVGILIIAVVWSMPVGIVYLVHRFMKWQEWRNHKPEMTIENVVEDGRVVRQITRLDGKPVMVIGELEGGF